ncbi:MAG: MFS transporter [Pseudomonadota bacterium]
MDPRLRRRALTLSVVDGMCYSVMVGVSESYLGALAVELGHRDTALALLVTVPILTGALAQLGTGVLVDWLGSRRRVAVVGALGQALCHLGFLAIAWTGHSSLWSLLLVKVLFWISGSIIAPAWNAWMGSLTEGIRRERYFAWRSAAVYLALLLSYVGAGVLLEHGRLHHRLLAAYAVLYVVALLVRVASATALALQAEPPLPYQERGRTRQRLILALRTARWPVALFVAAMMFGVHISAPYFTPYILRTLGQDYTTYALLTSVSILTKTLVFPLYHRIGERLGLRATLVIAGIGVALVPLWWSLITSIPTLFAVEALSGVVWAGFEFASFQLLLSSADDDCRVEFFSLATSLSGLMQLLGSLVGSMALLHLALNYTDVFMLSSAARAVPLLLLLSPAVVVAMRGPLPRMFMRVISVRAVGGVEQRPILHQPVAGVRVDEAVTPAEHPPGSRPPG